HLRELTIAIGGEGGNFVQLARDELGEPGAWAEEGQPIMAREPTLFVGDSFSFWARGVFSFDDREGEYPVEFIVRGTSIRALGPPPLGQPRWPRRCRTRRGATTRATATARRT